LDAVINRFVAVVLDLPVEILLPEGGSSRQLFWSGSSAVVRVHAVGGPPYGDFTNDVGAQRTAQRRPNGLGAVVAGLASNVFGQVGDQLGPLGQVGTEIWVIIDRLGDSGEPGQWFLNVGECGSWKPPVQDGGHVSNRPKITPECRFS
jgi:hypothetical protein